jgi:hypothetical protein
MLVEQLDSTSINGHRHNDFIVAYRRKTILCQHLTASINRVTDHTADGRSTDCSQGTPSRENCSTNSAYAGADSRILISMRHTRTAAQAEQQSDNNGFNVPCLYHFHGVASDVEWIDLAITIKRPKYCERNTSTKSVSP